MLISDKHKFIFIHVPRTAGQSINSALKPYSTYFRKNHIMIKHLKLKNNLCGKHQVINLKTNSIVDDFKLPKSKFNNYFKFMFVRNPWDLEVSRYFLIKKVGKAHYLYDKVSKQTFREFIKDDSNFERPQIDYGLYKDKKIVDYIGKFETLKKDFNKICKLVEIDRIELPHKDRNSNVKFPQHKYYSYYYTKELKEIINHRYKKDIESFNYKYNS